MRKPCTFEELPTMLRDYIAAVCETFEVLKCKRIDNKEFKCFVKDGSIVGIFSYRNDSLKENVSCTWLSLGDVEILHNATQESTRP